MEEEMKNFKVKNCLKCGTETNMEDYEELFCSKCGSPLVNRCSNYTCNKMLKEDALYCKHCGSKSTFKNYGLLEKDVPPFIFNEEDDLPF